MKTRANPLPMAGICAAAVLLAGCDMLGFDGSDDDMPVANPPTQSSVPAEVETAPEPELTAVETLESNTGPSESMTGSATFLGPVTATGLSNVGTVEDTDASAYQLYTPILTELSPGKYRLKATYKPAADNAAQQLFRIRAEDQSVDFEQIDILLGSNNEVVRETGGVDSVDVSSIGSGHSALTVVFDIPSNTVGQYRFAFYPAAGISGRYETSAVGAADIGDITLEKVEWK